MSFLRKLEVLAGDLLKFRTKKDLEALKRKKRNSVVLKNFKREKEKEAEGYDDHALDSLEKIAKIGNVKDLGRVVWFVAREDDFLNIQLEFEDELQEKDIEDRPKAIKLAKEYKLRYPRESRNIRDFEENLVKILDEGVDTMDYYTYQFYLLPEHLFGKADIGRSSNLLNPDERDIYDRMRNEIPFYVIAIYSNDQKKYKRIVDEIRKEAESNVG